MSQFDETGEEKLPVKEINLDDPALSGYAPPVDPEAPPPKNLKPAPPSDGVKWVRVKLDYKRKDGPPVYVKGTIHPQTGRLVDGRVVLALEVREVDEKTGEDKAYLKNWYPSTTIPKGSTGSQVTAMAKLQGKPTKSGDDLPTIARHMEQLFLDAGDEGLLFLVRTRWTKSMVKVDENGLAVYGADGKPVYAPSIVGEKRIKQLAALQGIPAEAAHHFEDPVTGEDRYVQAEVHELLDHNKLAD